MKFKFTIVAILAILSLSNFMNAQIPIIGLSCYYPMNGNANDSSGNGNNGIVHGAMLTSDRFGNPNSAYKFNGISDYITVNNSSSFPKDAISICFWFNREGKTPTRLENYISKENSFQTYEYANSKMASGLYKGSAGSWSSYQSPTIVANNSDWVFYVFTFENSTRRGNIYINGMLDSTFSETSSASIVRASSYTLYIGRNGSSSVYYINGKMDDIRIYNRVLNQSEVTALNNEGKNCLVAYFPFSGNANDASGNGNNGTVHGATLAADRFGNPNSAYKFNGISDYITVNNSSSFPKDAISICFWFNREGKAPTRLENYISKENSFQTYEYANSKMASGLYKGSAGSWSSYQSPTIVANNSDWVFYAFTFDNSTGKGNIYINGILDSTFTETNSAAIVRTSSYPLYIGRNGSSSVYYINGKMDDIRIYSCALSSEEVQSLFGVNSDIAATNFSFLPQTIDAGAKPTSVSFRLTNNGPTNMATPNTHVDGEFFISRNTTFGDGDDIQVGLNGYDFTLASGAYTDVVLSTTGLSYLTIPAEASGDYYVFVRVLHKTPSVLIDPTSGNNYAMRAGTIKVVNTANNSDIAATIFSFLPQTIDAGAKPTSVSFRLSNNGPANLNTPNTHVDGEFFISRNTTFGDGDDIQIGLNGYDFTLASGAYTDVMLSTTGLSYLTIPAEASGDYYVFVRVLHKTPSVLVDPTPGNNYAMRVGTIKVVNTVAIADLSEPELRIFPNPAKSNLSISSKNLNASKIEIINTSGSIVLNTIFKNSIDISGLPSGLYIVKISDKNGNILKTEKIMKE